MRGREGERAIGSQECTYKQAEDGMEYKSNSPNREKAMGARHVILWMFLQGCGSFHSSFLPMYPCCSFIPLLSLFNFYSLSHSFLSSSFFIYQFLFFFFFAFYFLSLTFSFLFLSSLFLSLPFIFLFCPSLSLFSFSLFFLYLQFSGPKANPLIF